MYQSGRREPRLRELASEVGFTEPKSVVHGGNRRTFSATEHDLNAASEALKERRLRDFESKKHLLRRSASKSSNFKLKEIAGVLEDLLSSTTSIGHAGQANEFLKLYLPAFEQQAASPFKRRPGSSEHINFVAHFFRLVELSVHDLVEVLAPTIPQEDLDSAIKNALRMHDRHLLDILMNAGASAIQYQEEFRDLVLAEDVDFITTLLDGKAKFPQMVLDAALLDAATRSNLGLVTLLLKHGANADFNSGEALAYSIRADQPGIVVAMCMSKKPPTPRTLDQAIDAVECTWRLDGPKKLIMIEILLASGAEGDHTARLLVKAATDGQRNALATKLVDYGASLCFDKSEAIFQAMIRSDHELFEILTAPPLDTTILSNTISRGSIYLRTIKPEFRLPVLTALVRKGQGRLQSSIDGALLYAAKYQDTAIARYLVEEGASAGCDNGLSICFATEQRSEEMLDILLQSKPSAASMSRAVSMLGPLPRNIRLSMATALLHAGAKGEEVNDLLKLMLSSSTDPADRDYSLIHTLVKHGANVNDGVSVHTAAGDGDLRAVSILLRGNTSPETMGSAIPFALRVNNEKARYDCVDALLTGGAFGNGVEMGLLAAMDVSSGAEALVTLFIGKGKINPDFNGGQALLRTIEIGNIDFLRTILRINPSAQTVGRMLERAFDVQYRPRRRRTFSMLLEKDVEAQALNSILTRIAQDEPEDIDLVKILLSCKASVDYDGAMALRKAIEHADMNLFTLLAKEPMSSDTLAIALKAAANMPNALHRSTFSKIILDVAKGSMFDVVTKLLPRAAEQPENDLHFLSLLLTHGSVNHNDGECIQTAIKNYDLGKLDLFLASQVSKDALQIAFQNSLQAPRKQRKELVSRLLEVNVFQGGLDLDQTLIRLMDESPPSHNLISLLLDKGASVHSSQDYVLTRSVETQDAKSLGLLLKFAKDRDHVSAVFDFAMQIDELWLTNTGAQCLELLLTHGTHGPALNSGLIKAAAMVPRSRENAFRIIDVLIEQGASGKSNNGEAIRLAAGSGDLQLVKKLLFSSPPFALCSAIYQLFLSPNDASEDDAVQLLDALDSHFGKKIKLSATRSKLVPILYLCLSRWPDSTLLLPALLRHGDYSNEIISEPEMATEGIDEKASVLLWAICCQKFEISVEVVQALIAAGGKAAKIEQFLHCAG